MNETNLGGLEQKYPRDVCCRFRLGISDLILPQKNSYTESAILCPACRTEHEDEIHFLSKCPAYVSIRQQHIPTNESSDNILKKN